LYIAPPSADLDGRGAALEVRRLLEPRWLGRGRVSPATPCGRTVNPGTASGACIGRRRPLAGRRRTRRSLLAPMASTRGDGARDEQRRDHALPTQGPSCGVDPLESTVAALTMVGCASDALDLDHGCSLGGVMWLGA